MKSLKGHFLVASTDLTDPNFVRTVILLVHHDEDGAFGVVLNRVADITVAELWEKVAKTPCRNKQRVRLGGPVTGPLMVVHGDRSLAEMEILPGVYFAAQRENLERLLGQQEHPYLVFYQHSGWGAGQLENELKQGAWLTVPATRDYVFCDESDLWQMVRLAVGKSVLVDVLGIDELPNNPGLN
jgi:putative transcriptional regulator